MVEVYRPNVLLEGAGRSADPTARAPRSPARKDMVLALIDNNKPKARVMLQFVAEQLRQRVSIGEVIIFTKPTAGEPIVAPAARDIAFRANLVIAGVGD